MVGQLKNKVIFAPVLFYTESGSWWPDEKKKFYLKLRYFYFFIDFTYYKL